MDFLNKFAEQLRDLFASMTPGAKITTAALIAVVVVSMGFLFKQTTSGPGSFLFGGEPLTRPEIIAIEGALARQGLGDYEIVGQMVKVPRSKQADYVAAIANGNAMPKSIGSFIDDALKSSSPLQPSHVTKEQFKAAKEKKISKIIGNYNWVQNATVTYDEKDIRGRRMTTLASATVSVMPAAGEMMDSARKRNLQRFVAGNFASMSPQQVVVINLNGDDDGGSDVKPDDFDSPYFRIRTKMERYVKNQVLGLLRHIPGVRVEVSVELDETLSSVERATTATDPPVVISEQTTTSETNQSNSDPTGPPGVTVNGPRGRPTDPVAERKNTSSTKTSKEDSISKSYDRTVELQKAGLVPKSMQSSITVPRDYVINVWRQRETEKSGKVPELVDPEGLKLIVLDIENQIKTSIEPLMPELAAGKNDFSQVKVVMTDTLPAPMIPQPSVTDKATSWFTRNASTLAMVGLAGFSLVMLRSMVRSGGGDDSPSGAPSLQFQDPSADSSGSESSAAEEDGDRPKLRLKKADTVKDDLADMVREDPDAAAAILSNWINNAS